MHTYQTALLFKLLTGAKKLPTDEKEAATNFILSTQCSSGGFRGRSEASVDLYYTAFALRGLVLLGEIDDADCLGGVAHFLELTREHVHTPADLFSYTFCFSLAGQTENEAERRRLASCWQKYRLPDGCYAASTATRYSSTYTTFLAANAFDLLDASEHKSAIDHVPILRRQRPDGGFVELEPLKQSGTNPTAAAIALLKSLSGARGLETPGLEAANPNATVDFLLARQLPDGGFQANTKIPVSDLLSSFTAFVALSDLGEERRCNLNALENYISQRKMSCGGYCGADWDQQCDVEYTFYGLALKSLLAYFAECEA